MSNNTYDFGFTFEDPIEPVYQPTEPTQPVIDTSEIKDEIISRISSLEQTLMGLNNQQQIDDYKELIRAEAAGKLKEVEDLILPLLYNLQGNPEKEYIHWPNRVPVINAQIDRILAVTRFYKNT